MRPAAASPVHDLNSDRWSAGLYLGALTGAGLDYNADWTGRYQATRVDMLLATLAPTLGYRLTDRLSVGLSLQFWYSELTQKLKVLTPLPAQPDGRAKLDGDDTGVAYTLGAMYELSDRTRFGLMYQSTPGTQLQWQYRKVQPRICRSAATRNSPWPSTRDSPCTTISMSIECRYDTGAGTTERTGQPADIQRSGKCRGCPLIGTTPITMPGAPSTGPAQIGPLPAALPTTPTPWTRNTGSRNCRWTGSCATPSARNTR